jgi:hypothetical protein
MGSVFGEGFANSLKRRLAGTFELFGGVYNFFAQMFTGDQGSFNQAAKDLGFALLRFAVNSFEFMFIQLPMMVLKLAIKVEVMLKQMAIRIGGAIIGLIAEAIDRISPKNLGLAEKAKAISNDLAKNVENMGSTATAELDKASKKVAEGTEKFNDTYLRSAEDRAKVAKLAAEKVGQAQATAVAEVGKRVAASGELEKTSVASSAIRATVEDVAGTFDALSTLPSTIKSATAALKGDALKPAIEAVNSVVKLANQLDQALSDGNLNKVDIKARLANVANAVGLGEKSSYTVTNKPVNITVNLTVTMNAEDLEKAMIMRASSVIRDRLNFATGEGAGRRGSPSIPESPTTNLQKISAVD